MLDELKDTNIIVGRTDGHKMGMFDELMDKNIMIGRTDGHIYICCYFKICFTSILLYCTMEKLGPIVKKKPSYLLDIKLIGIAFSYGLIQPTISLEMPVPTKSGSLRFSQFSGC
jgi:hypothetical protein